MINPQAVEALEPPCGWPQMLKLFIEASAALIRQAQASEFNEHSYEQLLAATQRVVDYGQQGLSALATQPAPQPEAQAPEKRCPLCRYQHGHAIGCANNPVDLQLAAHLATSPAPAPLSEEQIADLFTARTGLDPEESRERFIWYRRGVRHVVEHLGGIGLDGGV